MTCIVGIVDKEKVWIGGDAIAIGGWSKARLASPKVFRVGPLLIGGTGEMRTLQSIRYYLKMPEPPRKAGRLDDDDPGQTIDEWVAHTLVDAIRDACKVAGYAKSDNSQDNHPGSWLIGYRGHLFLIDSAFGVSEATCGYDTTGVGADIAIGALYATNSLSPKKRIQMALEAAEEFSIGVCGPFTIECLED